MIKASSLIPLLEEYLSRFDIRGKSVEVFVNPSRKELRTLGGEFIRFIADADTKKVYAWEGYSAVHGEMARYIKVTGKDKVAYNNQEPLYSNLLIGVAQNMGNSIETIDSIPISNFLFYLRPEDEDSKGVTVFRMLLSQDWRWLDRYIFTSEYLRRVEGEMEDILA